jgi:hypothetical protein
MSDAFDGAGKPFRGASYRALLLVVLAVVIGVILVWLVASWGINVLDQRGMNTEVPRQLDPPIIP